MSTAHRPTLEEIRRQHQMLQDRILITPRLKWASPRQPELLGDDTRVTLKLELLQLTGSFKLRAALGRIDNLTSEQRASGVVVASSGCHGIACAYAAQLLGVDIKVFVPRQANPFKVGMIEGYGAKVVRVDEVTQVMSMVQRVVEEERRAFLHPFDGYETTLGTGTLGYEFHQQVPDLDAVVVPVGGGGLLSGVALATKLINPHCEVFGVEPLGSDVMYQSIQAGTHLKLKRVETIADSLNAPFTAPYSFGICRDYTDDFVRITDEDMRTCMRILQEDCKLAVEPASACAMAGLEGPLAKRLRGKHVGLIVCGANIDHRTYAELLSHDP